MALRHGVYDSDTHFTINPSNRALKNEGSNKTVLIQYDHNSERFTFEIPRYIESHDMSLCNVVQVHFNNQQSKGVYDVTDMQISPENENVIIMSWLVSSEATQYAGSLEFLIRFSCVENGKVEYVWSTAIYSGISISNGIYNSK
jgi:hypothetical protein